MCHDNRDIAKVIEEALGSEDVEVRREAASALGTSGDSRAVEPLIQLADDPQRSVRIAAIEALGDLGFISESLLLDLVKRSAMKDLGKPGTPSAFSRSQQLSQNERAFESSKSVDELRTLLCDDSEEIAIEAAVSLGLLGDTKAISDLTMTLFHGSFSLALAAAEALRKIDPEAPVRALREKLGMFWESADTARLIGMLGWVELRDDLTMLLSCPDPYIIEEAAKALIRIDPVGSVRLAVTALRAAGRTPSFYPDLLVPASLEHRAGEEAQLLKCACDELIKDLSHEQDERRGTAAFGLGILHCYHPAALPSLIELLESDNERLCRDAAFAIQRVYHESPSTDDIWEALSAFLERDLSPEARRDAVLALESIVSWWKTKFDDTNYGDAYLETFAQSLVPEVRVAIIRNYLQDCPEDRWSALVEIAQDDDDHTVRAEVVKDLWRASYGEAVEPILRALRETAGGQDPPIDINPSLTEYRACLKTSTRPRENFARRLISPVAQQPVDVIWRVLTGWFSLTRWFSSGRAPPLPRQRLSARSRAGDRAGVKPCALRAAPARCGHRMQ